MLLVFFCLHTHINTATAIAFEHLVETVDAFVLSPLHSLLKSNFDVLKAENDFHSSSDASHCFCYFCFFTQFFL